MKTKTFLFASMVFVLASCTAAPTSPTAAPQANLANPASVYCEEQGNRLEIRTAPDGSQSGVCIFPDGSECDEWAYFRGECAPASKSGSTVAPSLTSAGLIIAIPNANPPTLDGTLSPGEWDDAWRESFSDGSELFLKHAEGYLYLGIRANPADMIVGNIFVDHGDQVSILHSSAALGTAIYEKRSDGWERTQDFVWRCRDSSNSPSAQAAREKFFQEEGWLANISYMGTPQELEYKIAMPGGSLQLAVTFTPTSDVSVRIHWPVSLADDCINAPQGRFPTVMQFSPSTWVTVTVE
jgi:putative hemolysin